MIVLKRALVVSALALSVNLCYAQTVADPAYANMQRSVGGIIQQSAVARGFSTTDPRTYGTLYAVGKVAVSGAAGAGAGLLVVGTAPAWGTVLAVAAISGAVSYGVSLGLDSLVKWKFGSGTTPVATTVTAQVTGGPFNPISGGTCSVSSVHNWCGGADFDACLLSGGYNPTLSCRADYASFGFTSQSSSTAQAMQAAGYAQTQQSSSTTTTDNQTLAQAISGLTAAQKAQTVSYDAMALMINDLWKKASAQTDYVGVPYDDTKPVTTAQVQMFAEANPGSYPKVEALVAPVTDPAGFAPSTTTATGTATTPATAAPGAPSASQPFPTDYSREVTQQKILQAVDGTGMPSATALDQNIDTDKVDGKNNESVTALGNITPASVGLFDWFPHIQTAECEEPKVPNPLTGAMVDVPICGSVSVFSKFITAVICFFALIGSVHNVQSALKA